ncbi:MAG: DUF3489 domain-containing protein [Bryobacteraceae bacterium]|jgi:hypothetical protein
MLFEITEEGHILTIREDLPGEAERSGGPRFTNEQELHEMASAWPMKRLVEIWNRLPGATPVQKFENRRIAIARIWRAIAGEGKPCAHAVPARRAARNRKAFREGSKGAQVGFLLSRPEGATLKEIRTATGWQAHTVRGFISRTLRKQGRKVRSFRKDGERVYRLKS